VTTQTIRVQGMTCANCVRHVAAALLAVPGVGRAEVDLARGEATLEVEAPIADATLAPVLDEAGYRLA
jgi:copper chaperone CopZ